MLSQDQRALVVRYLPYALAIARRISRDPEAESAAQWGLLQAARGFDARRCYDPKSYIRIWVMRFVRRETTRDTLINSSFDNIPGKRPTTLLEDSLPEDVAAIARAFWIEGQTIRAIAYREKSTYREVRQTLLDARDVIAGYHVTTRLEREPCRKRPTPETPISAS